MIFLCMIIFRNKTVAHTLLFQQYNSRLYQERLLRSTNFATMVTLRRTSPLYTGMQLVEYLSPMMSCNDWM